jgi:hypothetical protein
MNAETKRAGLRSAAGLLAEVLSVFLPVLVIWLGRREYQMSISATPEWSVGATILFGQAIVKFTTSISKVRGARGPTSLTIVLMVMGIVVSSYLLVKSTALELSRLQPANSHFDWVQVSWFFTSAVVYMAIGILCDLVILDSEGD